MPIWRIEPVADAGDPIWQEGPRWERVLVRAPTAALARVIAEQLDAPASARPGGRLDELYGKSRFAIEKAYRVVRADGTRHPETGPHEVLEVVPERMSCRQKASGVPPDTS